MTSLPQVADASKIPDHHVLVQFGAIVPPDLQGEALLLLELFLRQRGCKAEVYKPAAPDDLRSRAKMTEEQRTKL